MGLRKKDFLTITESTVIVMVMVMVMVMVQMKNSINVKV